MDMGKKLGHKENSFFNLPVLDWILEKGRFIRSLEAENLVKYWKENAIAMAKDGRGDVKGEN